MSFSFPQVYHFCQNSQLQTFTCPEGQAFHHVTSKCEDASVAECIETMADHSHHDDHHHHKRSVEVEEYHTIDIYNAKTKVVEAYRAIKPIVLETIENVAPTIYTKFQRNYIPALKNFKDEVLPYFREKILPQIRKEYRFALNLMGQIFEKIYRSYELSDSNQITIVSFNDIVDQITNEIKPLVDLGRYLSAKALKKN